MQMDIQSILGTKCGDTAMFSDFAGDKANIGHDQGINPATPL
jgi:hypothetical protein